VSRNSIIQLSLHKAFEALANVPPSTLTQLSTEECALLLVLLPGESALADLRLLLARRLRSMLNHTWIGTGPASEVFLTLAALYKYDAARIPGECLAGAVQRLLQAEAQVGGPYRDEAGLVSLRCNAYIALFLRTITKPLPNVETFVASRMLTPLQDNQELDFQLLAVMTEASTSPLVVAHIAHTCGTLQRAPLHSAISILLARNPQGNKKLPTVSQALANIRRHQLRSGLWEKKSLFSTGAVVGSSIVATALLARLLIKYQMSNDQGEQLSLETLPKQYQHETAVRTVRLLFNNCAEPLRSTAINLLRDTCQADVNQEITTLPLMCAKALTTPNSLSDKQHRILGAANLCSWIAYTVYDDFLDGEGTQLKLPVANIALRAAQHYFEQALPEKTFHTYVAKTFQMMDEANAWEASNCRFTVKRGEIAVRALPAYGNRRVLADRSFAHALAPMCVFLQGSPPIHEVRRLEDAFRHYLIARQLSDDSHDWYDDVCSGLISYVVAAILQEMSLKAGAYDLQAILPGMKRCFRQIVIQRICHCILQHVQAAKDSFAGSQLLRDSHDLYFLLEYVEASAHQTLDLTIKGRSFSDTMR